MLAKTDTSGCTDLNASTGPFQDYTIMDLMDLTFMIPYSQKLVFVLVIGSQQW